MSNALPSPLTLLIDGSLAAALVVSLGLVCLFDGQPEVRPVGTGTTIEEPVPQTEQVTKVKSLRLAVTPEMAQFDDVGRLLDGLGDAYSYRRMPFDDLLVPEKLEQFDIVFLTCSGFPSNWLGEAVGGQQRGNDLHTSNKEVFARARESLRQFVSKGGTLYASDLHFSLIAEFFPEYLDFQQPASGAPQTVRATVEDAGLREMIGDEIELTFDQEQWLPAAFAGEGLISYLRGEFRTVDGDMATAPLLVKFRHGDGNIIFTSFHNEKQTSEKEKQLLKYLVFSTVTAGVDAEADRSMARGGFAQTKKNIFSASKDADAVSQVYDNKRVEDLQFVLAFPEQGATLELSVTGPDGTTNSKRGTSTIMIDVPQAAVGAWKYTIMAVKVPSENFPFTITVGRKK